MTIALRFWLSFPPHLFYDRFDRINEINHGKDEVGIQLKINLSKTRESAHKSCQQKRKSFGAPWVNTF